MHSHEVTPAIGDIFQKQDGIQLEIRLNLEAFLSGIDLSDISNTDEATQSAEYDFYRGCLLYTSPSPRDATLSRMPSSA